MLTSSIRAGQHILTVEDPLAPDLREHPRPHQVTRPEHTKLIKLRTPEAILTRCP